MRTKFTISLFLAGILMLLVSSRASAACFTRAIGNYTQSSTCTIDADSTEVVESAQNDEASTTNDGVLTVSGAITMNSGVSGTTTLAVGSFTLSGTGSIALGSTSVAIKLGGTGGTATWVTDGDADGYAGAWTYYTSTAAGRRRMGLMRSSVDLDCNDAAYSETNTCYSYSQAAYWSYGYGQGGYWRYSYGQSAYWRYTYGQSAYWRYTYSQSYYSACFTGDTKVLMADGTTKKIKDIREGDVVVSYDLESGKTSSETVSNLFIHPNTPGGYLVINGVLKVTPNHLIYSPSRDSWVKAESLAVGETLLNSAGERVNISSIEKVEGTNTVYNLGLPGPNHTFFTEDFLVHNHKPV